MAGIELQNYATVDKMSNQQYKAGSSATKTWIALGKLLAPYNFAASPFSLCMISTQITNLEEHLHVANTTSTVASLRVARPTLMAGVELDRCASGHEMSNQQSEKPDLPQHKTCIALGKLVSTYKDAASPFLHYMISTQDSFKTLLAGGCTKLVILTQLPVAIEMWAQMGQTTNTAWQNTRAMLRVQV